MSFAEGLRILSAIGSVLIVGVIAGIMITAGFFLWVFFRVGLDNENDRDAAKYEHWKMK